MLVYVRVCKVQTDFIFWLLIPIHGFTCPSDFAVITYHPQYHVGTFSKDVPHLLNNETPQPLRIV